MQNEQEQVQQSRASFRPDFERVAQELVAERGDVKFMARGAWSILSVIAGAVSSIAIYLLTDPAVFLISHIDADQ